MSVVGFDVGNESCVVAVARQRAIDIILDGDGKAETPAVVCFGDKQRFIGTAASLYSIINPKNRVSQIKRLLGRRFTDPELQRDIQSLPFAVSEAPDGSPLIHANYLGEQRSFTPIQILAMILSNLKDTAQKNLNAAVVDCCIGIPVYFTDLQRRAMLHAASIAGLHPLRLLHETTATALAYGIYRTDFTDTEQVNVAFVDVSHASMQVCIAGFKNGQLRILAQSYDSSLGGRDFDRLLFNYFAAEFKEKYKIDVYGNARACLRLRAACEKLKNDLSVNPKAQLYIQCLVDETDVQGSIKREEFEQLSVSILDCVKKPLEDALADAGLTVDGIHSVEVVGSGSHIPAITRILAEFFGKEPRRTMNANEAVARGCALQCAILSPTYAVRKFEVHEKFPFPISLSWKGSSYLRNGSTYEQLSVIFPRGNKLPSIKAVTFYRSSGFSVDLIYTDLCDLHVRPKISTYMIGPFQSSNDEFAKLKLKVCLNIHGIVSVESATMLEEEVEVEVSADKDDAQRSKVKKIDVPVAEMVYGELAAADLQKAVEKEFEMALQDKVIAETKDKKNAVEAYVYDMRNKLHGKYNDFVSERDKEELSVKLQEVENWLYEDGEDETKGVYVAKLEELKKHGDLIEERYKEWIERGPAINQLVYCINSFREAALSKDPKFDHIGIVEKHKVINECQEAESWMKFESHLQDGLPKYATSVLCAAELKKKAEDLDRFCKAIMTKPKPQTCRQLQNVDSNTTGVKETAEMEFEMAPEDSVMEDTADKRNAAAANIYDMRNKTRSSSNQADERDMRIMHALKIGRPIVERGAEDSMRNPAQLYYAIDHIVRLLEK